MNNRKVEFLGADSSEFDLDANGNSKDSNSWNTTQQIQDSYVHKPSVETYSSKQKVVIPDADVTTFSFRKLWAFTGPGFLMSIAYLDPGNIESDLQAGSAARFKLLWVLLGATVLGLLLQRLCTRLGIVTGHHLAEMCYRQYKKGPRLLLWIMIEIAIIGGDMQEVIGTAIALYLLSNRIIPLWAGVMITIVDTFTFLFLDKYGLRKLEFFFGFLMLVMGVSFGYEYVVSSPPHDEVFAGMFTPWCSGCGSQAILQAISIIGAVIMPHNLYLHSALVKSRAIDRQRPTQIREANKYVLIETIIALIASFIINVFVVAVFGYGLFDTTNAEMHSVCQASNNTLGMETFEPNDEPVQTDLYSAGMFLGCQFGAVAMYIWAVGILASGQASTMTGTYTGQFAMEGFLNLQWARWKRVLFTRTIAIIPTLAVAFIADLKDLSEVNEFLNAVMSLQLPFAILPTIAFTSSEKIMGEFKNGLINKIIACALAVMVISINIYFVFNTVQQRLPNNWAIFLAIALVGIFYFLFCFYLVIHMSISMGATGLSNYTIISKYVGSTEESNFKPII